MFLESSRSRPSTTPLARIWAVPRVTQQRAHGRGQYPTPRSRRSLPEAGTILGVRGTAGTVQEVERAYRAVGAAILPGAGGREPVLVVNNANGQGQGAQNNGQNQAEWAPAHLSG